MRKFEIKDAGTPVVNKKDGRTGRTSDRNDKGQFKVRWEEGDGPEESWVNAETLEVNETLVRVEAIRDLQKKKADAARSLAFHFEREHDVALLAAVRESDKVGSILLCETILADLNKAERDLTAGMKTYYGEHFWFFESQVHRLREIIEKISNGKKKIQGEGGYEVDVEELQMKIGRINIEIDDLDTELAILRHGNKKPN